jgi:hypothetical protein
VHHLLVGQQFEDIARGPSEANDLLPSTASVVVDASFVAESRATASFTTHTLQTTSSALQHAQVVNQPVLQQEASERASLPHSVACAQKPWFK